LDEVTAAERQEKTFRTPSVGTRYKHNSATEGAAMYLHCRCGYTLTSIASPGRIVHKLLSEHDVERLQNTVDGEIRTTGEVDWPEPWDSTRYAECWLCPQCSRLFVGLNGPDSAVRVYTPEAVGIAPEDTGIDSQLAPMNELYAIGMREAGESPLCVKLVAAGAAPEPP
jgi:hypothetical protein